MPGSFVLALVAAPSWAPRDLDIYFGSAGGFDALSLYFENNGLKDITPPPPPGWPTSPTTIPWCCCRGPPHTSGCADPHLPPLFQGQRSRHGGFVDLIRTRSTLPGNLVLRFPASCAMSWLTANEIVAAARQGKSHRGFEGGRAHEFSVVRMSEWSLDASNDQVDHAVPKV